ncbi:hypothetical protein K0M31_010023 [Melipona bicolor]|uniref:Uncharacterized protein n=1 Tax=Melipona bicolor TaxID=60889 RepID=A0AA40FN39_9HYME|nr:hypothetical protein K0M31_010023 [Melipona bicolor]
MLAGVGDRSYRTGSDTEGAATTDNPTTPFPTPPPTLTPNHRQASPFPLESTNSRRHHYNGSISSERSRNGNGETVYAAPSKKTSTGGGTLGRRTRRGHTSALSSSSTASDRSETVFPDEHTRMHLTNGKLKASPSKTLQTVEKLEQHANGGYQSVDSRKQSEEKDEEGAWGWGRRNEKLEGLGQAKGWREEVVAGRGGFSAGFLGAPRNAVLALPRR